MAIPKIYNPNPGSLSGLPPIVLGVLAGMDKQGETILGTWLYGGGVDHDVEDPSWTAYMMEHKSLRLQILARLMPAVKKIADLKKLGRFPIAERFHAEFPENSGFSGYALLHGSNKDVGDFLLAGFAEVQEAVDPAEGDYDIELELRFVFNDIVDPNGKYVMDRIRSIVAHFFTVLQPRSYRLSINWSSSCLAEVRKDKGIFFSGYPSEHPSQRRQASPSSQARLGGCREEAGEGDRSENHRAAAAKNPFRGCRKPRRSEAKAALAVLPPQRLHGLDLSRSDLEPRKERRTAAPPPRSNQQRIASRDYGGSTWQATAGSRAVVIVGLASSGDRPRF
jgi:hypothetical protein